MPRKCSLIGCRGNYEARKGEHADVSVCSAFPRMNAGRSNGCIGFLISPRFVLYCLFSSIHALIHADLVWLAYTVYWQTQSAALADGIFDLA